MDKNKKVPRAKSKLNVNEIKELIIWAKKQKIASFSYQDLAVQFSPLALIEEDIKTPEQKIVEKDMTAEELKKHEEAILFHST